LADILHFHFICFAWHTCPQYYCIPIQLGREVAWKTYLYATSFHIMIVESLEEQTIQAWSVGGQSLGQYIAFP